jgi:hypothetical protein
MEQIAGVLALSIDMPSPDHSTFSRFRDQLATHQMVLLNDLGLRELEKKADNK